MNPFPLSICQATVTQCITDTPTDQLFLRAWTTSLKALTRREKAIVSPITGRIAESVAELLLQEDYGYSILLPLDPGTRGVDLVVLSPAGDKVIAI